MEEQREDHDVKVTFSSQEQDEKRVEGEEEEEEEEEDDDQVMETIKIFSPPGQDEHTITAATTTTNSPTDIVKLADLENKNAHDMYLGLETGASLSSVSISALSDVSITPSDLTSVASESMGRSPGDLENEVDYSVLDRYGFIVVAPKDGGSGGVKSNGLMTDDERDLKRKQEQQGRREARRAIKWVEMLKVLETIPDRKEWCHKQKKFESRLLKGIPECMRTKLWGLFLSIPQTCSPSNTYKELYLKISGFERQIDLDIERTLRDHILFKARFSSAQVSLFKILVAYSNLDPEVGYCQGMSTIAAFLLIFFEEEMAFLFLKRMMEREGLRSFFTAGFPLLFETFYVQEQLMRKYVPAVFARLESFHITTSVYATKWYLTLFLGFPFSLSSRIWDLFTYWGMDILVCVSLALIKLHESRLMTLEYENCMQFLSKLPDTPIDEQKLVKLTWTIWTRVNPHYDDLERSKTGSFSILRENYGKVAVTARKGNSKRN